MLPNSKQHFAFANLLLSRMFSMFREDGEQFCIHEPPLWAVSAKIGTRDTYKLSLDTTTGFCLETRYACSVASAHSYLSAAKVLWAITLPKFCSIRDIDFQIASEIGSGCRLQCSAWSRWLGVRVAALRSSFEMDAVVKHTGVSSIVEQLWYFSGSQTAGISFVHTLNSWSLPWVVRAALTSSLSPTVGSSLSWYASLSGPSGKLAVAHVDKKIKAHLWGQHRNVRAEVVVSQERLTLSSHVHFLNGMTGLSIRWSRDGTKRFGLTLQV